MMLREMDRRGLTISTLARRAGVHRDILGRWLSGKRHIRLTHALALMEALGLTITTQEASHERHGVHAHRPSRLPQARPVEASEVRPPVA